MNLCIGHRNLVYTFDVMHPLNTSEIYSSGPGSVTLCAFLSSLLGHCPPLQNSAVSLLSHCLTRR